MELKIKEKREVETWINNIVEFLLMKKKKKSDGRWRNTYTGEYLCIRNVLFAVANADLKATIKLNKLWQQWGAQQTKYFPYDDDDDDGNLSNPPFLMHLMPQFFPFAIWSEKNNIFIGIYFCNLKSTLPHDMCVCACSSHESNYMNAFLHHVNLIFESEKQRINF